MPTTLQARQVTLDLLRRQFGLQLTTAADFFSEWLVTTAGVTVAEQERLDRVKAHFLYLSQTLPLMEDAIKMVVISPLLELAGFYDSPFHLRTETSLMVTALDEETVIQGKVDILVALDDLWVVIIESKNMGIGLSVGIPQALSYMLANPEADRASFGLVTNGSEFVFLKLCRYPTPQYASSRVFSMLSPVNELYDVLQILKNMGKALTIDRSVKMKNSGNITETR